MKIQAITLQDKKMLQSLSDFASEIIREHYDPILGSEQNDYMLEKFQSVSAMEMQIIGGYRYYLVLSGEEKAGFLAFYPKNERMYLSKFYIHKAFRGKSFARKMLLFVKKKAKEECLTSIFLNVNRYNSDSIAVYQHFGFYKIADEKNDIGHGYYMDDYVLEYLLD